MATGTFRDFRAFRGDQSKPAWQPGISGNFTPELGPGSPPKHTRRPDPARLVGRRIASEPGFDYSPALRRLAERHERWTPDLLDRFLADPEAVAPGTEMGFRGMSDDRERRALIAWLSP